MIWCLPYQNYEGYEILLHLQTNKLAYYSFMDADRRNFWVREQRI